MPAGCTGLQRTSKGHVIARNFFTAIAATAAVLALMAAAAVARGVNPQAGISTVSCASVGNCSAVTTYSDAIGFGVGLLLTEKQGKWGPGINAQLPKNSNLDGMDNSTYFYVGLQTVDCASAGDCSAVGAYITKRDVVEGLFVDQKNGKWSRGVAARLLAKDHSAGSEINSVACTGVGDCTAAGFDITGSFSDLPAVFTETNGTWAAGQTLKLPANAYAKFNDAALTDVSCSSAGNCVAVGSYINGSGDQLGLIETETSGSWAVEQAPLPSGAATTGKRHSVLNDVSCPANGACVAVGMYTTPRKNQEALTVSQSAGVWQTGQVVALPAGAITGGGAQHADISALDCVSAGNCSVAGYYTDAAKKQRVFLLNETSGTWAPSEAVTFAAPNASVAADQATYITALSCTSAGNCLATGQYGNGLASLRGFNVDQTAGTWQSATLTKLPSNAVRTQQNWSGGVSCVNGSVECTVVGAYTEPSGNVDGFMSTLSSDVARTATAATYPGVTHAELAGSLGPILDPFILGTLKQIRATHTCVFYFRSAERGSVAGAWYATVKGHRTLIGSFASMVPTAGRYKLKLKLTAAGRKLFKGTKKFTVKVTATFKPAHGATVREHGKLTLS